MNHMLVGRDGELAILREAAEQARAGRGSLILLAGEAGMGKTVLCRHALGASGLRVFEAAARQAGTAPYGQLVAVLRAHRRHNPDAPDVESLLTEVANAPARDHAAVLERLATTFVSACGEEATGVLLDDLQWADDGTLELIVALAPLVENEPVLVIGTYRSDELTRTHPVRRLRSELRRQRRLHEIPVQPLPANETGLLLGRVCGDCVAQSLVAVVLERTGGVPFFVEELGAALLAGGRLRAGAGGLELRGREELPLPDNIRDAVLLRAAGLDDATHAALGVAAALGQRFDPDLAAALSGLDRWPSEALRRGVVVEDSGGYLAFRHDLIREAFYDAVPWAQRPALHRQIAERLQESGAPLATVAQHWADGREPDRARRAFLRAADEFCAVYACRDGARAIRRALDLWPEDAEESDSLTPSRSSAWRRSAPAISPGRSELGGRRRANAGPAASGAHWVRRSAGLPECWSYRGAGRTRSRLANRPQRRSPRQRDQPMPPTSDSRRLRICARRRASGLR